MKINVINFDVTTHTDKGYQNIPLTTYQWADITDPPDINELADTKTLFYKYPLKSGYYCISKPNQPERAIIGVSDALKRLGVDMLALEAEPLSDADKQLIQDVCCGCDLLSVRRKLSKEYPAEDLDRYTWQDICVALRQTAPEYKPSNKEPQAGKNWHNADYTTITVDNITYTLNKQQGRVFEYLHANKTAHLNTIQELLDSQAEKFRLLEVFRIKGKIEPAYNLIEQVENKKGIYRLKFDFSE
jgi:hypothetical protein